MSLAACFQLLSHSNLVYNTSKAYDITFETHIVLGRTVYGFACPDIALLAAMCRQVIQL